MGRRAPGRDEGTLLVSTNPYPCLCSGGMHRLEWNGYQCCGQEADLTRSAAHSPNSSSWNVIGCTEHHNPVRGLRRCSLLGDARTCAVLLYPSMDKRTPSLLRLSPRLRSLSKNLRSCPCVASQHTVPSAHSQTCSPLPQAAPPGRHRPLACEPWSCVHMTVSVHSPRRCSVGEACESACRSQSRRCLTTRKSPR